MFSDQSISTDLVCYAYGATALAVAAAQWLFIVLFSGEIVNQYTPSVNHAEHMDGLALLQLLVYLFLYYFQPGHFQNATFMLGTSQHLASLCSAHDDINVLQSLFYQIQ